MNQFLNRLNLRPQERRLIVGVAAILFVVVNLWLVWPHRHDWKAAADQLEETQTRLQRIRRETDPVRVADYQARLKEFEGEGEMVLPAEQTYELAGAIISQANKNRVSIQNNSEIPLPSGAKTNEFFEEKARQITFTAMEKDLVDFLIGIGSGNSMIRARNIVL